MKYSITGIVVVLAIALGGCMAGVEPSFDTIIVVPENVTLAKGTTQQFQALDGSGNDITDSVTWNVVGGETNGTISNESRAKGLYSAPAELPLENLITVSATRAGATGVGQAVLNLTVGVELDRVVTFPPLIGEDLIIIPGYQSLVVDDSNSMSLYVFGQGVFDDDPFVNPPDPIFDSVLAKGTIVPADPAAASSKASIPTISWTISDGIKTAADDNTYSAGMVLDPSGFLQMYHVVGEQGGVEVFQAQQFTSKQLPLSASDIESGDIFSTPPGTFLPLDEVNFKWSNQPYLVYGPEGNFWQMGYTSDLGAFESKRINLWKNNVYFGEMVVVTATAPNIIGPYTPRMAFDSSGMGYILYGATPGNTSSWSQLYLKIFDGTTFGSEVQITNAPSGLHSASSLVIDNDDNIWIGSAHQNPDNFEVVLSIYKSTDGQNFSIEHQINLGAWNFAGNGTILAYPVMLHVDELGNTLLAYFTHDGTSLDLQLVKNFGDPLQLNTESNTSYDLFRQGLIGSSISMDTDSAGRVYLTTLISFDGAMVVMVE